MFNFRADKTDEPSAKHRTWIGALALAMIFTMAGIYVAEKNAEKEVKPMTITKEAALKIAEEDAKQAYRDLSGYEVAVELDGENWQVDYNLKKPELEGGGAHYLISGADGRILSRRYEQ